MACRATWTAVWCVSGTWAWWWESAWALAWILMEQSWNLRYSQCVNYKIQCCQLWRLPSQPNWLQTIWFMAWLKCHYETWSEFVLCCGVVWPGWRNPRAAFSDDSHYWRWTRGWACKRVSVFTSLSCHAFGGSLVGQHICEGMMVSSRWYALIICAYL